MKTLQRGATAICLDGILGQRFSSAVKLAVNPSQDLID